ncbi:uncharacterized protein LOC116210048 isoform X2 [Punica granatum]|uniref:Uncharacterized protein LOC116210048 isoform X2 n=1 Tax=Punica granatum TaxID=22663 RepID=A0A6P8E2J7_PUNGR|nr:uncharacterized protein LOC116210048 isoform X2 [Punica granatum]XP_031399706.1 uncharacterized protein LOC116210048 isoform X2 [Punica granatum]
MAGPHGDGNQNEGQPMPWMAWLERKAQANPRTEWLKAIEPTIKAIASAAGFSHQGTVQRWSSSRRVTAPGHPMPLWDWLEKKAHALISVGGADLEAVWLKAIEPTIKEIARCQLSS